jgi:wobble nucleotide-excising tRNase
MLSELLVAGAGSYAPEGQRMTGLRQVNFVFGSNGSGKTTISRALAAPPSFPACATTWLNNRPLECLVYNSDFAADNFAAATAPGIFTLGQDSVETREAIADAKHQVDVIGDTIDGLRNTRDGADRQSGKTGELKELREQFERNCWTYKVMHDPHFADAFEGVRSNKTRFCDRILEEHASNTADVHSIESLKARALQVFEKGIEPVPRVPVPNFGELVALEAEPVLERKIVGKDDIDIAALIRRLGNSDWVKRGLDYVTTPEAPCPFCQREIPPELIIDLKSYFDESYLSGLAAIDRVMDAYKALAEAALARLEAVAATPNRYLDMVLLRVEIDRFADRLALNVRHLERKRKEASTPVALEPIAEISRAILDQLEATNLEVTRHNETIDNLATEKASLKSQVWKALLDDGAVVIGDFVTKKRNLDNAIAGLEAGLEDKRQRLAAAKARLAELERNVTSVEPTVTAINATLTSFGFTNFRLATSTDGADLYRIVRIDGTDVGRTLSEGEKGFITFLYFFNRIRGSTSRSGVNSDRIVVFDDPVSSFDSDVLFVVSSLIRSMIDEACRGNGDVKQVVVLTHNIYFYKEVSFDHKRSRKAKETFWIVRKDDDVSTLHGFDQNPIRTSYQLLWDEVRSPQPRVATIQNTLRRILEHYFTILGGVDRDDIVAEFHGSDSMVCASLFSWINDGSHSMQDDIYVSTDAASAARYLRVFKEIFDRTGHGAHYGMMIGSP